MFQTQRRRMGKSAQITVFIVIGIVILFATSLYFYVKYGEKKIEFVPAELKPVKNYVDKCVYDIGKDGLQLMALQGGYIEIPDNIRLNPLTYLPIDPDGAFKIPFWYYDGKNRVPLKTDIEKQLDYYVASRLQDCLGTFEGFKDVYDITSAGPAEAKTSVNDKTVSIMIRYPLDIRNKGTSQQSKLTIFGADLNVALGRIYELAKTMMEEENKGTWLENFTIDLMVLSNEIPFTDMAAGPCHPLTWKLSDIKSTLKDFLFYNIPRIKIERSDYTPFSSSESFEKLHMTWDATKKSYKDLRAGLYYDRTWPLTMTARPSSGGILRSGVQSGVMKYLGALCINIYHFTYDVDYPVMLTLTDTKAFNGEGYSFRLAFPVIINHNQAKKVYTPMQVPIEPVYRQSFCEARSLASVDIRATDSNTWNEISGANVTYECLFISCPLGSTKQDNIATRLMTTVPAACGNGDLFIQKDGYLPVRQSIISSDASFTAEMKPLKSMKLDMRKYRSSNLQSSAFIDPDETALVTIQGIDNPDLQAQTVYPFPEGTDRSLQPTLDMIDGDARYHIEIMMLRGDSIAGGYKGNLTVYYNDIHSKDTLMLNVVSFDPAPTEDQGIFSMMEYIDNSTRYADTIKPTFE